MDCDDAECAGGRRIVHGLPGGRGGCWGKSERAVTGWIDSRGGGLSLICRTESVVHARGEREREKIELTDEMRFSAISYQQPQPGDSDLDPGSKPDTVHSTPFDQAQVFVCVLHKEASSYFI